MTAHLSGFVQQILQIFGKEKVQCSHFSNRQTSLTWLTHSYLISMYYLYSIGLDITDILCSLNVRQYSISLKTLYIKRCVVSIILTIQYQTFKHMVCHKYGCSSNKDNHLQSENVYIEWYSSRSIQQRSKHYSRKRNTATLAKPKPNTNPNLNLIVISAW